VARSGQNGQFSEAIFGLILSLPRRGLESAFFGFFGPFHPLLGPVRLSFAWLTKEMKTLDKGADFVQKSGDLTKEKRRV